MWRLDVAQPVFTATHAADRWDPTSLVTLIVTLIVAWTLRRLWASPRRGAGSTP